MYWSIYGNSKPHDDKRTSEVCNGPVLRNFEMSISQLFVCQIIYIDETGFFVVVKAINANPVSTVVAPC